MKTKLIEKIRSACIKANPEIVELKFGCRLKSLSGELVTYIENKETETERGDRVRGSMSYFRYDTVCRKDNGSKYLFAFNEDDKIIGRPIHLADVLLTIDCGGMKERNVELGGIWIRASHRLLHLWNLKETAENQSEETLKFISELLDK